jgi:hypothetical protein
VVMPSTAVHQKHVDASERVLPTTPTLIDGDGDDNDGKLPV